MPPDEAAYDTGVRTVRCLAGHGLDELKTSQFGQLPEVRLTAEPAGTGTS
jgi:hypothetical protein